MLSHTLFTRIWSKLADVSGSILFLSKKLNNTTNAEVDKDFRSHNIALMEYLLSLSFLMFGKYVRFFNFSFEALRDRQRLQLARGRYDTYMRLPHETHRNTYRRLLSYGSALGLGASRQHILDSESDTDTYSSQSSFAEEYRSSKEKAQQLAIHE